MIHIQVRHRRGVEFFVNSVALSVVGKCDVARTAGIRSLGPMRFLIRSVFLLAAVAGCIYAAPAAPAQPKLGGYTVVGRINADSSRWPADGRPYEKYSYNLRAGDQLVVSLQAAREDGAPIPNRRPPEAVVLYHDRGDGSGLQEVEQERDGYFYRVTAPATSTSGETTYYFYAFGRRRDTIARYDLSFYTTTQKEPYPVYQHLEMTGRLEAYQNSTRTFDFTVPNWSHRFRVESQDFQPKLERQFDKAGQRLTIKSSTDRQTATSATTIFKPSPPGRYHMVVKNQSNRPGAYRLVGELPFPIIAR